MAIRVEGTIVQCFINNGTLSGRYSLIYWLDKYAMGWILVRGTSDWGVLDEKRTHPYTDVEGPNVIFGLQVSFWVIIVTVPWLM